MNFGERIRSLRKKQQLNQSELAEKMDVHLNTINRWENMSNSIDDLTKLVKLSHVLGTTVAYLRGESENPTGDQLIFPLGEYSEATPKIESIGDGHVFYYECNGQKVEIPAKPEFIDLFLRTTREMRLGLNTQQPLVSVNNRAQAKDNAQAIAVAGNVGDNNYE